MEIEEFKSKVSSFINRFIALQLFCERFELRIEREMSFVDFYLMSMKCRIASVLILLVNHPIDLILVHLILYVVVVVV